ncbi:MAG: pitrilysin family protein [Thermoanaerobaculia bacterium]
MRIRPLRCARALAIAAAAVLGARASAAPPRELPRLPVREFTLENGMRFLLVPQPESRTVAAGWVARVGSLYEHPGETGTVHFLEHMMFKGSRTIASGELGRLYSEAGGRGINALTLQDMTLYFVVLPAEKLELWFWLESDRVREPAFRELVTEKKVVAEERRLRIESTPTGRLDERLRAAFWKGHPYGGSTLGSAEDIAALDRTRAEGYLRTYFRPDNLTAALVGNFEPDAVRRLAERYFGRLARPALPLPALPAAPPALTQDERLPGTCSCRDQVEALYRTVAFTHPDRAPLEVLVGLLNGRTGRLYQRLVLEKGQAFSASALQTPLARSGFLSFSGEARGGTSPEQLLAAWDAELVRLREEPIPPAELEKVKNQILADGYRRFRDPSALMMQLLMSDGFGDWHEIDAHPRRALAVTAADVSRVVATYLDPARRTVGLYRRTPEGAR